MNGTRIKELRIEREWSQQELAVRSGMAQSHIAAIENGKSANLTTENVKRLAAAFEMPPTDLFAQLISEVTAAA